VRITPAILLATIAACHDITPDEEFVRHEFSLGRPTASISTIVPEQSDPDDISFRIQFRALADTAMHEEVWLYQRTGTGSWHLTSRDSSQHKP